MTLHFHVGIRAVAPIPMVVADDAAVVHRDLDAARVAHALLDPQAVLMDCGCRWRYLAGVPIGVVSCEEHKGYAVLVYVTGFALSLDGALN